jgi:hypothetical protein
MITNRNSSTSQVSSHNMPPAQTRRRRFLICVTVMVAASLVIFVFIGPLLGAAFPSLANRTDFFLHKDFNDGHEREREEFRQKNDQFQQHPIQQQAANNVDPGNINSVIESHNPMDQQKQQQRQQEPQIENPPVHVSIESLSAAEKMQCPASVLSFVINATDIHDECEGLRKAFDKTCGGHPTNTKEKHTREKRGAGPQRRLSTLENIRSLNDSNAIKVTMWNPIRDYLKIRLDSLKHRETQETQPDQVEDDNLEPVPPVEEDRKPISPSLPTSSLDVNDVTLNESLTLHTDLDEIAKAIDNINNHTMQESEDTYNEGKNPSSHKSQQYQTTAEEHAEELKSAAVAVSAVINSPEMLETQACCRSILKVFHEECDSPEEEEFNDKRLFVIVCVIALCGMVKSLIRHFKLRWLPEAGGCILVGMIGGFFMRFLPNMDFGFQHDMFLRLMVPPIGKFSGNSSKYPDRCNEFCFSHLKSEIVFEAALNINKRSFSDMAVPIVVFSIWGTFMSTILAAGMVYYASRSIWFCTSIPFIESLAFGSLISSIDPIAVLSVLNNMGMSDKDPIYVLIFGESLLNDGVAIVLFQTLIHFMDEKIVIDSEAVSPIASSSSLCELCFYYI